MTATEKRCATLENAITMTGYGKFNIIILLASGGCLMTVILETMCMMFIVPLSQCDLDLDLTMKGILTSISFLGVVASSHLWGFIADTKGRRNVLIASMIGSCATSMITSIVPLAWLFILIRFLNGCFVGGASAVIYAYVGEFHDNVYRPKVVSWVATFVAFGNMVLPGIAWLMLPNVDFSLDISFLNIVFRPWRLLIICYGLPALFFGIWLLWLPESPKYLLAQGKSEEALEVLKNIHAMNYKKQPNDFPIDELISDEIVEGYDNTKDAGILKSMWNQTVPLFKNHFLLKTCLVSLLQFGVFFSSTGLLMWYPEVLNNMATYSNANPNVSVSMCDAIDYHNIHEDTGNENEECTDSLDVNVFQTSIIIGASFAAIYIFMGIVINSIGTKRLLLIFLLITTSCGLGAQYVSGQLAAEALMGIFLTSATCVGIINAITVELFPTQLRGMALSISLMAGRLGAVAGANAGGPLIYKLCEFVFYVYGVDHLVLMFSLFLLKSPSSVNKMITPNV